MPRLRRGLAVLLCTVLLASRGESQGSVSGIVRDTAGRPLADAEVLVQSQNRRARTDSAGSFTIGGLPAATYDVRTRRIGYYATQSKARVVNGATATVTITLRQRPTLLDTVRVTAECHRFDFSGFVCRRRNANSKGVFFDVNAIDSANHRYPVEMLRDVPGFRVVAVSHGLGVEALTGWRCVKEIVNGRHPTLQNPKPNWPKDMVGVEIYRDPDDVPPEYKHFVDAGNKRCGVINYWTVPRPRKR